MHVCGGKLYCACERVIVNIHAHVYVFHQYKEHEGVVELRLAWQGCESVKYTRLPTRHVLALHDNLHATQTVSGPGIREPKHPVYVAPMIHVSNSRVRHRNIFSINMEIHATPLCKKKHKQAPMQVHEMGVEILV